MSLKVGRDVIAVDLRDEGLTRSLFFAGDYEPVFKRLAEKMELGGSTCVDVGANIGVHTLHLARLAGPEGRVVALEPDDRNFELLAVNLALNGATKVEAVHAAAGDVSGSGQLERSRVNFGDHRLRLSQPGEPGVKVVVLDDLLGAAAGSNTSFIKIDVQGFETFVLRGLRQTIARNRDAVVLLELSPALLAQAGSSVAELLTVAKELGLEGWEIGQQGVRSIASAADYEDRLHNDEEHLILSRNRGRLGQILAAHFGPSAVGEVG